MQYDVIIVGAGVVGCAIARELSKYQLRVAVLEREAEPSCGTSKANSGVVHAGYDARPDTTMALLNVRGQAIFAQLAKDLDIHYYQIGSLVVALEGDDLSKLLRLYEQGQENGVPTLRLLEKDELRSLEPNLTSTAFAALYAPTAGIVSPYELTIALAESARVNGVDFFFDHEVIGTTHHHDLYVSTARGRFTCKLLINCAGVHADEVSRMVGDASFTITPVKGTEAILDKQYSSLVRHVIFPLPGPNTKGIIVAPTVHGNLLIGPTAVSSDKSSLQTSSVELADIVAGAQRLIPQIPKSGIITSYAGLRAVSDTGDFVIEQSTANPQLINVGGIKSPGLTAAPAIGESVASLVRDLLRPLPNASFNPRRKSRPRLADLPLELRHNLIKQNPLFGQIVCRCEEISAGEILAELHSPLPPKTMDGLKQRLRVGMGRCQGGFCTPHVIDIMSHELNLDPTQVTKKGPGSELLACRNKEPYMWEAEAACCKEK